MASVQQPFRDPARNFTPNGRPMRKPRRIAMDLASVATRSDFELEDFYVIERPSGKTLKHMSLRECLESRPPVKLDLEGPTPCTYTAKLPTLTVLGGKINPKTKYIRDALPNPTTEVWTHKVNTENKSPTPCSYTAPRVFGKNCPVKQSAPAYTMSARHLKSLARPGAEKEPAPNSYDHANAAEVTFRHFPAFSIASRREGRRTSTTPGPAHYHPKHSFCQYRSPSFTMRSRTRTT